MHILHAVFVIPKVLLRTNKDNRDIVTEVVHFRNPLLANVLETDGVVHSETEEDHIRVRIDRGRNRS